MGARTFFGVEKVGERTLILDGPLAATAAELKEPEVAWCGGISVAIQR